MALSQDVIERYRPRPLNQPRMIGVSSNAGGQPLAVRRPEWPRPRRVLETADCWRIDDEWWRERAVSRLYYALIVEGGLRLTVYHDLTDGLWFEQPDNKPQAELSRAKRRR